MKQSFLNKILFPILFVSIVCFVLKTYFIGTFLLILFIDGIIGYCTKPNLNSYQRFYTKYTFGNYIIPVGNILFVNPSHHNECSQVHRNSADAKYRQYRETGYFLYWVIYWFEFNFEFVWILLFDAADKDTDLFDMIDRAQARVSFNECNKHISYDFMNCLFAR